MSYPEKFVQDSVVAPFVPTSIVTVTLPLPSTLCGIVADVVTLRYVRCWQRCMGATRRTRRSNTESQPKTASRREIADVLHLITTVFGINVVRVRIILVHRKRCDDNSAEIWFFLLW